MARALLYFELHCRCRKLKTERPKLSYSKRLRAGSDEHGGPIEPHTYRIYPFGAHIASLLSTDRENFIKPALSLNACFSDSDNGGWFKKIVQFRVLVLDEKTVPALRQEWDGLVRALGKDEYEDLVTYRQGKDYFRLMIKDVREGLKDVVLLSAGKDGSCLFVDLRGLPADAAMIPSSPPGVW